jgi:hypothetical protein
MRRDGRANFAPHRPGFLQWEGSMRFLLPVAYASAFVAPPLACADSFDDFRIPRHTTRSGSLSLAGHGSVFDGSGSSFHSSDFSTESFLALTHHFDSDPLLFDLSLLANAAGAWNHRSSQGVDLNDASAEDAREIAIGFARSRWYPGAAAVGFDLSVTAQADLQQSWRRQAQTVSSVSNSTSAESHGRERGVVGEASVGFGRVRDASVVFAVEVLEERLTVTGALARPLSPDARRQLSELFFQRNEFSAPHTRPERFFWNEVERILREDGALSGSEIGAEAILLALEPVRPVTESWQGVRRPSDFVRLRGFFVGPEIRAQTQYATSDEQFTPSSSTRSFDIHSKSFHDTVRGGARAEYHDPLGWHWQVDAKVDATMPLRPDEHGFSLASTAQVTWLVNDRWRSTTFGQHSRWVFEAAHSDDSRDSWSVDWGAAVSRFIEDHVEAFVQFQQNQTHQNPAAGVGPRGVNTWKRESLFLFGLQYRFLGALQSPGLFARQTPLTW